MPIDCKIKIKNYKCFGENEQGFDCICPINIIIGRNNSGKSSLIDLIQYVISPDEELFRLGHLGKKPEVFITQPLTEKELKSVFPPNASGGEIFGDNHWEFGQKWIGVNITYKLTKDAREFHSLEKPHWSSVKENNWLNAHDFEQIQSNCEMYQILKYASVAAVYPL